MAKHLTTIDQVFEEFGGYKGLAKTFGISETRAGNWLTQSKRFPANTFLVINEALRRRGKTASPTLWAMKQHLKDLQAS